MTHRTATILAAIALLAMLLPACGALTTAGNVGAGTLWAAIQIQNLAKPGSIPSEEYQAAQAAFLLHQTAPDLTTRAAALAELARIKNAYCPFQNTDDTAAPTVAPDTPPSGPQ